MRKAIQTQTAESQSRPIQSIGGVPLFPGFLEPTWGCMDVVEKLCATIENPRGILPQKYLYASLHGARLWRQLCEGDSHIAQVYRKFPLRNELAAVFRKQVEAALSGFSEKKLGVVALGAGTGKREAQICGWLVEELGVEDVSVLVVDVSSELLGVSLREFKAADNRVRPHFAVMDFESRAGLEHLKWLRSEWKELSDRPILLLLLGNTFGTIDAAVFLRQMGSVMRESDLLLCESTFVGQTPSAGRTDCSNDVRSEFICDPLRSMGINPKFGNLKRDITIEFGKGVKQEFQYHFDDAEAAHSLSVSPRPTIRKGASVTLLEIEAFFAEHAKELFSEVFSRVELVEHEYPVSSPSASKVRMGYVFASAPPIAPIGVTPEKRKSSAKTAVEIILHPHTLEVEVENTKHKMFVTHFAFVFALNNMSDRMEDSSAYRIQCEVVDWLKAYKTEKTILPQKAEEKLTSLETQLTSDSAATDAISNLKADAEKSLKKSAATNVAAKKLLEIWPAAEQWKFKPPLA